MEEQKMSNKVKKQKTLKEQIKNFTDNAYIDLTETGPLTYRQLQRANNPYNEDNYPEAYKYLDSGEAAVQDIYKSAGQPRYTQAPAGIGDSVYDDALVGQDQYENLNEIRANRQSGALQIANGLFKGTVLAGTTFADGTVGLLWGVGAAINEGRFSALFDNDFSRAMQAINKASEEIAPNYYSKQEMDSPWYTNIGTANFIGDKFIKNLGFTVGALYSGGVYSSGIRGLGKLAFSTAKKLNAGYKTLKGVTNATSFVAGATGASLSALNEARVEAINNSKEWAKPHIEQLNQKHLSTLREIEKYRGTEMYNKLIDAENKQYDTAMAKINEDMLKMGNADLLMNMPILTGANLFTFGKFFAKGFGNAKKARILEDNIGGKIKGKFGEYTAATTKKKIAYKATTVGITEGGEEALQEAANRVAGFRYNMDMDEFYNKKNDKTAKQEQLEWYKEAMNAFLDPEERSKWAEATKEGFKSAATDGSTWEQFFIGALTGWLGMPSATRVKTEGGSKLKWRLNGGIYGEIRDGIERRAREKAFADQLNARANSPEFKQYYEALVRHRGYENAKIEDILKDDKFKFKNDEFSQFISDIVMFDNAGKLEDLEEFIHEALDDTSSENIDAIIRNTSKLKSKEQVKQEKLNELAKLQQEEQKTNNKLQEESNLTREKQKQLSERIQNLRDSQELLAEPENKQILERQIQKLEEELHTLMTTNTPEELELQEQLTSVMGQSSQIRQQIDNEDFGEDTYIGNYVDKNGNRLSDEEIAKQMDKSKKQFLDTVKQYKKIKAEIDEATDGKLSKEQQQEIIWMIMSKDNLKERATSISRNLIPALNSLLSEQQSNRKEAEDILETQKDRLSKEQKEQLEKNVETYNANIKFIQDLIAAGDSSGKLRNFLTNPNSQKSVLSLLDTIDKSSSIESEQKKEAGRSITDLHKIVDTIQQFNDKIQEYLENPGLLQQHAEKREKKRQKQEVQDALNNIASRINWDGSIQDIINDLNNNKADIEELGGLNELSKLLTQEQKDKLNKAKKALKIKQMSKKTIEDSDIEDIEKEVILDLFSEADPENVSEALNEALDSGEFSKRLEAAIKDQNPNMSDSALIKAIEKGEERAYKVIKETLPKVEKLAETVIKAEVLNEQQKQEKEEINKLAKKMAEEPEMISEEEPATPPVVSEETNENPGIINEGQDEAPANQIEVEDESNEQQLSHSESKDVKNQKFIPPKLSQNGSQFTRRSFLSQYYLSAYDLQSYLDFIIKHPEYIPEGIGKDAYIKYLKVTLEYLNKMGAFDYVSGKDKNNRLEVGNEIQFMINDELNEKAGTKMAVIVTRDKQGKLRVIGVTHPTLMHDAKTKYYDKKTGTVKTNTKTFKDKNKSQVDLLNAVLEKYKNGDTTPATAKINDLMAGGLPLSNTERTLQEVFKGEAPVIAIVNKDGQLTTGDSSMDDNFWTGDNMKPWQIYVMIPSNKGIYLPALCYSTKLSEVLKDPNDWYIQQTVEAIKEAETNLDVKAAAKKIRKWINLPGLSIAVGTYENGKFIHETDRGKDGVQIRISYKENDKWQYYNLPLSGGHIDNNTIYKFLKDIAKKGITTNVDMSRLGNRPEDIEYRKNIAKYLNTNLVRGGTHTINDWFTYTPTEFDKKQPPKDKLGAAPKSQVKTIEYEGNTYTIIDSKVEDSDGNLVTPDLANDILEYARTGKTKVKPEQQSQKTPETTTNKDGITVVDTQDINLDADQNTQNNSQQSKNQSGVDTSALNIGTTGKTSKDIVKQLGKRPRGLGKPLEVKSVSQEEPIKRINLKDKTIEKVKEMFPHLNGLDRIVIVEGIINTLDSNGNPIEAYGLFKDGVLYLSDAVPQGSVYHEAFHYVTDFLLNEQEKDKMFKEASKIYGDISNIELEEKLAEDFRKFMNDITAPTIKGFMRRLFYKLKHLLKGISKNPDYLDTVFYNAYSNYYSSRREDKRRVDKPKQIQEFKDELFIRRVEKLSYDNLSEDIKSLLDQRHVTKEEYEDLDLKSKEITLRCMI